MTKIKLCGLKRERDIDYANALMPDYIGFVFAKKSSRYVTPDKAEALRKSLDDGIVSVGVFVNEDIEAIEQIASRGIIGAVQLHGSEDNEYMKRLRRKVRCPIIQAFRIEGREDIEKANGSDADHIMLDSGGGTGESFDHTLINGLKREFFLAGGLDCDNVREAISIYGPYAVDASSSLETDGVKDKNKMAAFVNAVRCERDDRK